MARKIREMSGHSILIIDDDPIQNELTTAYLRRLTSASIMVAEDGMDARRLMASLSGELALIICDLNMPSLDGLELLQVLADQKVSTPILIVTGAPDIIARSAVAIGAANGLNLIGLLRKALTFASLSSAVEPMLGLSLPRDAIQLSQTA